MMKIILYFVIFSILYNLFKSLKISFFNSSRNKKKKSNINYKKNKNNYDIVDAEYEEIN